MKNSSFSVAQALLMSLVPSLANNVARVSDGDLYVRLDITGKGGIYNLIDANTKKVVGESSFDGSKLPADVNMVLERVRIAYATCPTTDSDLTVSGQNYSALYSRVPEVLANAEFVITQGGTKILELPLQRFLLNDPSAGLQGDDAYFLEAQRHLKPQTPLEVQIHFPSNKSMSVDKKHFIEVHLIGPKSEVRG